MTSIDNEPVVLRIVEAPLNATARTRRACGRCLPKRFTFIARTAKSRRTNMKYRAFFPSSASHLFLAPRPKKR